MIHDSHKLCSLRSGPPSYIVIFLFLFFFEHIYNHIYDHLESRKYEHHELIDIEQRINCVFIELGRQVRRETKQIFVE